jgi:flagellar biosynthesis chaperone FliJ
MSKFQFRLQRALDWQRSACDTKEAELNKLLRSAEALKEQLRSVDNMRCETHRFVQSSAQVMGRDVIALAASSARLETFRLTLLTREAGVCQDIERVRKELLALRIRLRSLEKLRERRQHEYVRTRDIQVEQLSQDSHLFTMWGSQET